MLNKTSIDTCLGMSSPAQSAQALHTEGQSHIRLVCHASFYLWLVNHMLWLASHGSVTQQWWWLKASCIDSQLHGRTCSTVTIMFLFCFFLSYDYHFKPICLQASKFTHAIVRILINVNLTQIRRFVSKWHHVRPEVHFLSFMPNVKRNIVQHIMSTAAVSWIVST